LEHGHVAVIAKMHHAAIDGVLGVDLMTEIFDLEPHPASKPEPEPESAPEHVPSDAGLLVGAWASRARQPLSAFRAARSRTRAPCRGCDRSGCPPACR